jgi:group I intron endonuclease
MINVQPNKKNIDGIIYCAINKINGKRYIGQTTQTLKKRQIQHQNKAKYEKIDTYFANSLRKYGCENFDWVILDTSNNIEDLNLMEKEYILLYNSVAPNGYNLQSGGLNFTHSELTKKKLSKAHEGKTLSKEHRKKIGESLKGRIHSSETLKKLSETKKGEKNPNYQQLNDQRIIDLYENGMSTIKIAEIEGCNSPGPILSRLKNSGTRIRKNFEFKKGSGLFGFPGAVLYCKKEILKGKRNPFSKVWQLILPTYNKKRKKFGVYLDPLSCTIIFEITEREFKEVLK